MSTQRVKTPMRPRSTSAPLAPLPSIAVLPFLDLRDGEPESHLAEGLAEEVIQALKRVEGLSVVSRTTSFPYGGADLPLAEVGRKLRVDAILSGSLAVRKAHLVLGVELFDQASGMVRWSHSYDFERDQLLDTLEALATAVAGAFKRPLVPGPRRPVDLAAYEYYLKGRHYYFRFSRHGMGFASQVFKRATEIDPGYAPAWAGLAVCAAYSYIYIERTPARREEAETYSRKALELDPDLAEAHASRGVALSAAGQFEEAEEAFETALRLDPNLYEAAYFYARHCLAAGKPERAIEYFEWAATLRPEDFQSVLLVAQVYHTLGVEDEAERARRAGLALVEARLEHSPDDVRARYLGANALVALGEREKGLAWARLARTMDPNDAMLLYNLGCIHALAGDHETAIDCLGQAVAEGLTQKDWLVHDGDLDAIRSLPRFQELLARL